MTEHVNARPWGAPVAADDDDRPTCETCRFYRQRGAKCQRFPPVMFYDVNLLERVVAFPRVSATMWCGEYGARP